MSIRRPHLFSQRAARRGQAMVELALSLGVFMLIIGGIIQFGVILWSQNAVTEVARETARWAVTQSTTPCDSATHRGNVAGAADELARRASLVGYTPALWSSAPSISAMSDEGVGVDWEVPTGLTAADCPPSHNDKEVFVRVRISHAVPIFMPGLQFIAPPCSVPGFCVSSTTELRMEPKAP
jgi:hypothetical protein